MSRRSKGRGKGKQEKQEEEKDTLAYKVLSAENTKLLADIDDVDQLQHQLMEILKLTNHGTDLKEAAILDYYVGGVWWGKEQKFSLEQLSAFFSLLNTLLENVKEKQMTVTDNLRELKKMFAGIGVEASETSGGLDCFNVDQAKAITDYMHISLFQHYKMYEFMVSHTQAEEIIGTDLEVEIPKAADLPWPPPLHEALSEEVYNTYVATPPPTPASQTEEAPPGEQSEQEGAGDAPLEGEGQREADLLAQLTREEVTSIMDSVFEEMLGGLKEDVQCKLREKENAYITRINKIHRVADN